MQYITKENLPVFKYVNILPAEFYEDAIGVERDMIFHCSWSIMNV